MEQEVGMPIVVGQDDVVRRMKAVTRYRWKKALREKRLKPMEIGLRSRRCCYLARDVERCFGLEKGTVEEG